jgi:RNA polymerase sigma factor (sigma-70 family)
MAESPAAMSEVPTAYEQDQALVLACMRGEDRPMRDLQERLHKRLMGQLVNRGASETEAADLLADLWAECVVGREGRPPLFEKYHGKCALYTWLVTVATHRLVDLKRRQRFQGELPVSRDNEEDGPDFDRLPGHSGRVDGDDAALRELMRGALRKALVEVEAEAFTLLQLVYMHGVMQREVARVFGWHESKVSRTLDAAMEAIAARTMREIKAIDPWLELSWQDFVEMCAVPDLLRGESGKV